MVLSSIDADTVLHQILLIVRNYFEISHCAVLLVDKARNELFCSAQIGYDSDGARFRRLRIGRDGISGHVALNKAPCYVPDVTRDPRYLAMHADVRSKLCIPLVVRDEIAGVLDLESNKIDFFTDDMIGLVALFASQAAVALDNARLYTTERKRMRQIEFVNLIARSSTTANSRDQLLLTVSELLADTFENCDTAILIRNAYGQFEIGAATHMALIDMPRVQKAAHDGVIAKALQARSSMLWDGNGAPLFSGARSELVLPLISLGETLGVVLLSSSQQGAFSTEDRSIAQATADVCATAVRNVQLSEELRRVTNSDPLTGVYNQRYLHFVIGQELSRAKRFDSAFTVLGVDLRGFRAVNAEHGFSRGDDLLRAVASRIRNALRSVDTVCRYEADTFMVVLPEITGEDAQVVQDKLIRGVEAAQQELLQSNAGCAVASVAFPADGDTELHLIRSLLNRLYETKSASASSGR